MIPNLVGQISTVQAGAISLVVMIVVAILITVIIRKSAADPTLLKRYRAIATQLGGDFRNMGRGREAVITFDMRGRSAYYDLHPHRENAGVVLAVDMRGVSPGVLQIRPVGLSGRFSRSIFGVSDLEIGDMIFDNNFLLYFKPSTMAQRIFAPERRAHVIALIRWLNMWGVNIDLTRQKLTITLREVPLLEDGMLKLADMAGDLVEVILQIGQAPDGVIWKSLSDPGKVASPTGELMQFGEVVIQPEGPARAVASVGQCQVCGTDMHSGIVDCSSCGTPHHLDCWRYAGECSTYGCQERRYTRGRR